MNQPRRMSRRCFLFGHRYRVVRETMVHYYRECERCGHRRVDRSYHGNQPVNLRWLNYETDNPNEPMGPPPKSNGRIVATKG